MDGKGCLKNLKNVRECKGSEGEGREKRKEGRKERKGDTERKGIREHTVERGEGGVGWRRGKGKGRKVGRAPLRVDMR